jgi:2-iminobutanoate/2-iminopropanoate deaminase
MTRQAVTGSVPGGPYSPGIIAEGRLVFVAGQIGRREGVLVEGGIEAQTRATLDNVMTILANAGSGPEHVVRVGVFLTDLGDFEAMNAVYETYFPEPRPARTTVGVSLLGSYVVEIDCIAIVP